MATTSRDPARDAAALPEPASREGRLRAALALARPWFGNPVAIVLGGSHASGEAVWLESARGLICLSDVDLYVVLADPPARRAAIARCAKGWTAMGDALLSQGLAGPLELGFYTVAGWARLPARPATLELRRHGRVLEGDPAWRERLPAFGPGDVPAEEVRLLLENRAFELLAARWPGQPADPLAGLRSRHATYKSALDLAAVAGLKAGRWEDGAEGRVRAARELGDFAGEEPPWDAALAWRRGTVPSDAEFEADWWSTARVWVRAWRQEFAASPSPEFLGAATGQDFARIAEVAARRARWRRRMRLAVAPGSREGRRAPLESRLRHAAAGTPQHRLNASAGAFLAAICEIEAAPVRRDEIESRLARTLERLGVVRSAGEQGATARSLVNTWKRWVLDPPGSSGARA